MILSKRVLYLFPKTQKRSCRIFDIKVDWYDDDNVETLPPTVLSPSEVSLLVSVGGEFLNAQWIIGLRCLMNGDEYLVSECHESKLLVLWEDGNEEELDTCFGQKEHNSRYVSYLLFVYDDVALYIKVSRDDIDRAIPDSGSEDDNTESNEDMESDDGGVVSGSDIGHDSDNADSSEDEDSGEDDTDTDGDGGQRVIFSSFIEF
ncbi:unnamed protein product [Cochlearia groenlandica]